MRVTWMIMVQFHNKNIFLFRMREMIVGMRVTWMIMVQFHNKNIFLFRMREMIVGMRVTWMTMVRPHYTYRWTRWSTQLSEMMTMQEQVPVLTWYSELILQILC
jgi:hypothetical protein